MKWEELTTPEAVLTAFEAGRHVEYTAFKKDDIDMPASNRPNSGGWVTAIQLSVEEIVDELRKGRYRALIEDPEASADPFGRAASDALNHPSRIGIVRVYCDGDGRISVERVSPDEVLAPEAGPESAHMQRDRNDADALVEAMDRHIALSSLEVRKACAPPVPDGFTPWYGGECPVPGRTKVTALHRDGTTRESNWADCLDWTHRGVYTDIIAYRVERPATCNPPLQVQPDTDDGIGAGRTVSRPGAERAYWEGGPQPEAKAGAGSPINPHHDYLRSYWQDGYDGKEFGACTGEAPMKAYDDGRRARSDYDAQPKPAEGGAVIVGGEVATHYCRKCGALWRHEGASSWQVPRREEPSCECSSWADEEMVAFAPAGSESAGYECRAHECRRVRVEMHGEIDRLRGDCAQLRRDLELRDRAKLGDVWHWQGDGSDNLQSMSGGMVVCIRADELRELVAGSGEAVAIPVGEVQAPSNAPATAWLYEPRNLPHGTKLYAGAAPADAEALIRECVPGGSICDPQQVADNIREYFSRLSGKGE